MGREKRDRNLNFSSAIKSGKLAELKIPFYVCKFEDKRQCKIKNCFEVINQTMKYTYVIKIIPLTSYVTRPGPALLLEIKLFSNVVKSVENHLATKYHLRYRTFLLISFSYILPIAKEVRNNHVKMLENCSMPDCVVLLRFFFFSISFTFICIHMYSHIFFSHGAISMKY